MEEKVGIIITVRRYSSRIPEKALQTIGNRTAIEILLDNVINDFYPVVMAIPENPDDDMLAEIGTVKGVSVFRGHDDSPLHRVAACAKEYNFDYVVRVTADDILIDKEMLFDQIKFCVKRQNEYCYNKRGLQGACAEVIKTSIINQVAEETKGKPIEFISYYLKHRFKTIEYYPHYSFQFPYRCVMDYPEDLLLLRILFASIPQPVRSLDVIHFLRDHKYFMQINKLPSVTVYTCNYNTADYIIDAMQSVLEQTYTDFEYIIIDDHSTDNSMDVITEYISSLSDEQKNKIKVIRNETNKGLPACSNMAVADARGAYVVRLDSDDIFRYDFLEKMVESAKLHGVNGTISGYTVTDSELNETGKVLENKWHPACSLLSTWCVNELKYSENIKFAEGIDFWNRFKKRYKTFFVEDFLWSYRKRPGQKTQHPEHPNNTQKGVDN